MKHISLLLLVCVMFLFVGCVNQKKKDPWSNFQTNIRKLIPGPFNLATTQAPKKRIKYDVNIGASSEENGNCSGISYESNTNKASLVKRGVETASDSNKGLFEKSDFDLSNFYVIMIDMGKQYGTTLQAFVLYNNANGQIIGPITKVGKTIWARVTDGVIGAATYTIPSAVGAAIIKAGMENQSDNINLGPVNASGTGIATSS